MGGQPQPLKLYMSNVTVRTLDVHYAAYMSSFPIEVLKLSPRRHESLLDALFTAHTTFSHHFDHAAFDLMTKDTDCMLLDIVNLILCSTCR